MTNPKLESGDLITYYLNGVPPATSNPTVYTGTVARAMTAAEIADVQNGPGVPMPMTGPAFWVFPFWRGPFVPAQRTTGQLYLDVDAVELGNVLTVIKAGGDGDQIAGLLT